MSNKESVPKTPGQFRRKAAAWTAGLSLFGGMAAAETANAEPATATADLIAKHNEQAGLGAQRFITNFDKKLAKTVGEMHSSPYFSSKKNESLSKALHTVITVDFVNIPSKQYPGRYDQLTVVEATGEDVPLSVDITLGSDAKTYESVRHYESHSIFVQADNSGKFSPKTMSIQASNPLGNSSDTYYLVSSEGYPGPKVAEDTVKYSNDPAKVSAAYNAFLSQAESIVTRK